jgi:tRNA1(Val) A37 N6-methylase TrmN6
MYRPQMAKMVTMGSNIVLDPCCGWGGRMLGAVANGAEYYGFEPNTQTYDGLNRLAEFLNIEDKVHIYCDDALNMNDYDIPLVDCVLTSPPYFTLEVYTDEATQSVNGMETYDDWATHFLRPLISMCLDKLKPEGKSCWNVAKIKQFDMWSDVQEVHEDAGFSLVDTFSVASSKRQVNGKGKSLDETRVFQR